MPDILIRGMEMPTGELNYREIQVWSDGTVCVRKGLAGSMQQTDAEAIELPPHGDLIDMGKIQYTELYGGVEVTTANWIDSLPVIVPAERRGNDGN